MRFLVKSVKVVEKVGVGPLVERGEVWRINVDGTEELVVIFPKIIADAVYKIEKKPGGVGIYSDESPVGKKMLGADTDSFQVTLRNNQILDVRLVERVGFVGEDGSFRPIEEKQDKKNQDG